MRSLILVAALAALASARPETYKETEDFQYSRSSSDEGVKKGYYGAQRGNVGGNYEKAHNMDSLAQNQMSSAVNQVHSQVGDSARLPTGSVFTSANTKGIYNQGYEATGLQGRNFQEGISRSDDLHTSLSHLNSGYGAQSHSSMQNEGRGSYASYNTKKSGYSGYRTTGEYAQAQHNQDALNHITGANQNAYGRQVGQAVDYNQAGYGGYNANDHIQSHRQSSESRYGLNSQTRITSAVPVRVIIRPGSTVNVPVAAQAYDNRYASSIYDQNSIKNDAEVLSNAENQQISGYNPKSYESSYKYHKKWEKHDTQPAVAVPLAIPTVNPYPVNSELLEDTQGLSSAAGFHSSSGTAQNQQYASGYNSAQNSAISSQYHAGYNAQHQTKTAAARSNAYNSHNQMSSNADFARLNTGTVDGMNTGTVDGVPKKYESSYSYHKSWERQGDPYVIQPIANDGQMSQRLRAASNNQASFHSGRYATHSGYSQSAIDADCDCDDEGHVRVTRSAEGYDGQQVQQNWESEDLTQQTQQFGKLENFGQHSQNKWDSQDLTQQTQQSSKLEDFGQQSQNKWDSEDLTQQTQHSGKLENFGHQSQNKWDSEDLTQQTQQSGKLENFGHHSQNKWNSQDLTQQTQHSGKLEDFGHQSQNKWDSEDLTQQTQQSGKLENFGHHSQNKWNSQDLTQQTQHSGKLEDFGQQSQNKWDSEDLTQQTQQSGKLGDFDHHSQNKWDSQDLTQQTQQNNYYTGNLRHQSQEHQRHRWEADYPRTQHGKSEDFDQPTQNQWVNSDGQQTQNDKLTGLFQHTQSKVEDVGQKTQGQVDKLDQSQQQSQINLQETQTEWKFINQFKPNQDDLKLAVWEYTGDSQNDKKWNENSSRNANSDKSLQVLWDKIDNLAQQSSATVNNKENNWGQSSHNFQHSYQSWEKSNKESAQSSDNGNTYYSVHGPTLRNPAIPNRNPFGENPKDAGRGDIGVENRENQMTTETTRMFISHHSKPFKSLDEIEALSLTKETKEKANTDFNSESHSDDQLSVIGINQHWIEEQKRNKLHHDITTSRSTVQSQITNGQRQELEHFNNGYNKNNEYFNQHTTYTTKKPISYQNIGQGNLEQQSHNTWGANKEDLEQQVQTSWNRNENLEQQSDLTHNIEQKSDLTQKTENLNSNGKYQGPTDDFYEQRYQINNNKHSARIFHNEDVQTTNANVEDFSAVVTEITTPKPGFWKSVGNKFVNAKDQVSSWFKS